MSKNISLYNTPVVLFAYKRLDKLKVTIHELEQNIGAEHTDLFIFSDGAKNTGDLEQVKAVRKYLKHISNNNLFKSIIIEESKENRGLAKSVIYGVSKIINIYNKVIVLEDDHKTSKDFLQFMNQALEYYENIDKIGSISAYTYPLKTLSDYNHDIYTLYKGDCWGFATWKKYWNNVDWEVKDFNSYVSNPRLRHQFDLLDQGIDEMLVSQINNDISSWAVIWCYHLFKHKLLTVYPRVTRVINIGVDNSGEHSFNNNYFGSILNQDMRKCNFEFLDVQSEIENEVSTFMEKHNDNQEKIKFKKYYKLLNHWLYLNQNNYSIETYFNIRKIKTIAIYGMGELGQRLLDELINSQVEILYTIDKAIKHSYKNIKVVSPPQKLSDVDAIIVTPIFKFNEIKKDLQKAYNCNVISLEDVIYLT